MRTPQIIRSVVLTSLLSVAPVFAATNDSPDAWITTKTKLSLLLESNVPSMAVKVDSVDGIVTLHGKVPTEEAKTKSAVLARKIKGVKEVKNLLQVVPESAEKMVDETDANITSSLKKQFDADMYLKDSGVKVKSVNKGVVYLTGTTESLGRYLRAVEITRFTPGVRSVSSTVKVKNEYSDLEWMPSVSAKAEPNTKGDSDIPDGITTARVKIALIGTADVPALAINVDTNRGVVTLFGIVPSAQAKIAAENAARTVGSVTAVENELQVVPAAKEERVTKADDKLESELKKMYSARPELKRVDVEVKNGVARLTGSVKNDWERLNAVTIARTTAGVQGVKNDLEATK